MADLMASSANMEQCTESSNISNDSNFSPIQGYGGQALTFDRWQAQLLRNLGIPHLPGLLQRHPPDQLRQITRTRDRTAAPKRLELDIGDRVRRLVDPDLEFHDVAAGWGTDKSCTHIHVGLLHRSDIARVGVVVQDLFVVLALGGEEPSWAGDA